MADEAKKKEVRVVTNADVEKYKNMVNMWISKSVVKNWNEASHSKSLDEVSLGNSGMTMSDIRQHLMAEVVIAIQKYDPDYRTKPSYKKDEDKKFILDENGEKIMTDPGGRPVKESTFVYTHLFNRTGQLMKKLTKARYGYGVWNYNLEDVLGESDYYGND